MRIVVAVMGLALLAACTLVEEHVPQVELREGWVLQEVTPDGRRVAVTVLHGACDGYLGPQVVHEDDDVVDIHVAFAPPVGVGACDDIGFEAREVVELAAPLGERTLRGCGDPPCSIPGRDGERGPQPAVGVGAGTAVLSLGPATVGLDSDTGEERWRLPHDLEEGVWYGQPTGVGDVVLLVDAAMEAVVALDATTGEERWRGEGAFWYGGLGDQVGGDLVLLTPTAQLTQVEEGWAGGRVEARRPDGTTAWTVEVPGQVLDLDFTPAVVLVTSGQTSRGEGRPGQAVLTALDPADGTIVWQAERPGQPYDTVIDGDVVAVHVLGAAYGPSLADGAERWRRLPSNHSSVVHMGAGLVGLPAHGDELIDITTGEHVGQLPRGTDVHALDLDRLPRVGTDTVLVSEGHVVRRDVVDHPLVEDVEPAWAVPLLARAGRPVLSGDGTVLVPTPLGVRAFDLDNGVLTWSWTTPDL